MDPDFDAMTKAERKQLVVDLLVASDVAMPRRVLLRNLKLVGARFQKSALQNYLEELSDEGRVRRVQPDALERREIVAPERGERGYWAAANLGRLPPKLADDGGKTD